MHEQNAELQIKYSNKELTSKISSKTLRSNPPYGESFIDQRATNHDIRFKFTGKERDSETGFDYFGARYYSSGLSVWLSVDPLADKYPSTSPFMYVRGNPVMLIDPNGSQMGYGIKVQMENGLQPKEILGGRCIRKQECLGKKPWHMLRNITLQEDRTTGSMLELVTK